jgi:AcrR family transcriptional regulator
MDEPPREPNPREGTHKPGSGDGDVEPAIPGLSDPSAGLSEVARARRDQILDAAEAIIAGHGIQELSLGRIEKSTKPPMSRGQLTYYFPTKESILLALFDRMLRRMIRERMRSDGPKPMTGRAWEMTRHVLQNRLEPDWPPAGNKDLLSLLFTFLAQMGHREDYRARLSQWFSEWRSFIAADLAGSVPEPRPASPRTTAALLQALFQGLDVLLMADPEAFDRPEMLGLCLRLLAPLFNRAADPNPGAAGSEVSDGDSD